MIRGAWIAASFSLLVAIAPAESPLSAALLRESCRAYERAPDSDAAAMCPSYVQGYLDSARLGAEQHKPATAQQGAPETWAERATRTRLGAHYLEALRERSHRFCMDDSVDTSEVIERVLEYLRDHPPDAHTPAAQVLSAALMRHYPCEQ